MANLPTVVQGAVWTSRCYTPLDSECRASRAAPGATTAGARRCQRPGISRSLIRSTDSHSPVHRMPDADDSVTTKQALPPIPRYLSEGMKVSRMLEVLEQLHFIETST